MQLARYCQKRWNTKEVIHNASTNVFLQLQQNILVRWLQSTNSVVSITVLESRRSTQGSAKLFINNLTIPVSIGDTFHHRQ